MKNSSFVTHKPQIGRYIYMRDVSVAIFVKIGSYLRPNYDLEVKMIWIVKVCHNATDMYSYVYKYI